MPFPWSLRVFYINFKRTLLCEDFFNLLFNLFGNFHKLIYIWFLINRPFLSCFLYDFFQLLSAKCSKNREQVIFIRTLFLSIVWEIKHKIRNILYKIPYCSRRQFFILWNTHIYCFIVLGSLFLFRHNDLFTFFSPFSIDLRNETGHLSYGGRK